MVVAGITIVMLFVVLSTTKEVHNGTRTRQDTIYHN